MQRYFVSPQAIQGGRIRITGEDVKHVTRVMRFRPGDEVICANGQGESYRVRLTEFGPDQVLAEIVEPLAEKVEPEVKLTLVQGLPKGDKMDLIVQKGTEVGVSRFVPVATARTVVEYDAKKESKRRERWLRIAKEAAEQAHRLVIPEIGEVIPLAQWLEREAGSFDLVLLAYEGESERGLRQVLGEIAAESGFADRVPPSVAIVIGPEGGLDEREVRLAAEKGVRTITLGPRILRTETAGPVAAALIFYHFGQMGG